MPQRPLLLFPFFEKSDRDKRTPFISNIKKPVYDRQFTRLQPTFLSLNQAFNQKNIKVQNSPIGINPDFALVFETIGTIENFYKAIRKIEGLEWMFDQDFDAFLPDEDFYIIDRETKEKTSQLISGKLFCVMTNQQAINQLISLWERHKNGETEVFKRGFSGIRDVFVNIKNIRKWNALDRISETKTIEYWKESLEYEQNISVPFEIELFYRFDHEKRTKAVNTVKFEIEKSGGIIKQECVIGDIAYHSLLVELPRISIIDLVDKYEEIELTQVDDIMFFRPTCQSIFLTDENTDPVDDLDSTAIPTEQPLIAILDGMPIQNHPLLKDRIIVDDPDDYASGYESKFRKHGTAMASLVIYGDLNKNDFPIRSKLYLRPILKPKEIGNSYAEFVPSDKLLVDVIHSSIIRIVRGDRSNPPINTIKVINLSIGDPVRQFATIMSPLARLVDYLAYEYKLLFIISAGNHAEVLDKVDIPFHDFKEFPFNVRNEKFFNTLNLHQRNFKVLSPAESINSLTIGAIYDDFCNTEETDRMIYALERGMPSPYSSFGMGYRSNITPDLFYNGGRKFIWGSQDGKINWQTSSKEPGCKVASPYESGNSFGQAYTFGTSDAAAQVTHEAVKCYETLMQLFNEELNEEIPNDFKALLLKAMLTHGATWETISENLAIACGKTKKNLAKWLGNGIPNFDKVKECTKERVTLIGKGTLNKDEGNVFSLPLPIDLSSRQVQRKMTVTLAYFSPITPVKQTYTNAQLWFSIIDDKNLVPERLNSEWNNVKKGTLQHEIFIGNKIVVWNDDDIKIKVNCREIAGKITSPIHYCLFVTFEVAEGLEIDLYTKVENKIKQRVSIQNF